MLNFCKEILKNAKSVINDGFAAANDNLDAFLTSIKKGPGYSFDQLDCTLHRLHGSIPYHRDWDGVRDEIALVTTSISRLLIQKGTDGGNAGPKTILDREIEKLQRYLTSVERAIAEADPKEKPPAAIHDLFLDLKAKSDQGYFD